MPENPSQNAPTPNAASRQELLHHLPYARRYARALIGSQAHGDLLVADMLAMLLADDAAPLAAAGSLRAHLYRGITQLYTATLAGRPALADAQGGLSQVQRQLLLLTALEDVPTAEAASITGLDQAEAARQLADATDRLRQTVATDVMIIEDEPIIAMDIEELVQSCGHRAVGIAATEAEAVEIADRTRPGLILADINLGAGGDGSNAVARILRRHNIPVIFVTAYPERLLTGDALEPAFVITKPFEPLMLAIATYQAVTAGRHGVVV